MVEILRAISKSAQILVIDEPTSSLSDAERRALFAVIATLKSQGVSIVYVSPFLHEALEICDRVTVLKDGKKVGTHPVSEVTRTVRRLAGASSRAKRGRLL